METVHIKINNVPYEVAAGSTILEAAHSVGIEIPTLCYLKEINEIGACRICVVEVKGARSLVTACVYPVNEGMEIVTNSEKVQASRKTNLELLLSTHDQNCLSCVRSGNCELQQLCREYGLSFTESKADPFRIPAWKKRLCRTIKEAMENCATREEFIAFMAEYGYKVRWEPNQKYITYTTPENIRCRDNKLFDQTLLRSSMEAYFDMGGCEYLESRIDATEYGELLPTVDDAVCGLISILDAMNTGDNNRFHLETLHHSKQEIRRILERGGKIDRTVEYAVDDEEEEYEQYHGFSMRM